MYYVYAVILYLFVLFISVFVIYLTDRSGKNGRIYIILPINAEDDLKDIDKSIKEIYYEQAFAGKYAAAGILIADTSYREDICRLCERYETVDYILYSELSEYFYKRTGKDE